MEASPTLVTAVVGIHKLEPAVWNKLAAVLEVRQHGESQWITLKQGDTDVNIYGPKLTAPDPQDEDEA